MTFNDRMQALRDKWERLSQRERTMVGAMGVTFVLMVTLIVGFLITDGLSSMEERNGDMRQALRDLDTQRDAYLRNKAKTAQIGDAPRLAAGAAAGAISRRRPRRRASRSPIRTSSRRRRRARSSSSAPSHLRLHAVTLDQLTQVHEGDRDRQVARGGHAARACTRATTNTSSSTWRCRSRPTSASVTPARPASRRTRS